MLSVGRGVAGTGWSRRGTIAGSRVRGCTTRIFSTNRGRSTRRGMARGGCGTLVGGRAVRDS